MRKLTLLFGFIAFGFSSLASAVPIPGLFNTGVDEFGIQQAIGSIEQHYGISGPFNSIGGPFDPIADSVVTDEHSAWVPSSGDAQWIGASAGFLTDEPDGDYEFSLILDLTGLDPVTAVLTGSWAVDNSGSISLNGIPTGVSRSNTGFGSLAGFTINSGFVRAPRTHVSIGRWCVRLPLS
jgi:hypothetical protein